MLVTCINILLVLFQGAKVESLLGCTTEQMSYKKALEVLGITQAMMDDERAKILGSLGVKAWSNPEVSTGGVVDREGNIGSCGSLFRKRRHVLNEPGAAPMCGLAPSSHTEVRSALKIGHNTVLFTPNLSIAGPFRTENYM